jgi:glycosyltransferase involved in cell wall biosynthesis
VKVLYIINNLTKGGAERFVLDLLIFLHKTSSIEYRLAVLNDENDYEEYDKKILNLTNLNYTTFSLRKKNKNSVLKNLLDDFKPDIIHSNLFLSEFSTVLDVRKDIKYVCHGHDNMHQFKSLRFKDLFNKQRLLNRLEYVILKNKKYNIAQTYFIVNSKHTFSFFKKQLPKNQKKNVRLIQCGFNYDKYFQKNDHILNKKIRLVNVGSYQLKKNQQFIVDIAEVLKNRGVDFEINLIGDGSEFEKVKRKIEHKKLSNHVFQRGLQSNVQEWYQKSDIYLHSANYEPFGLVFLEAMAAGLPIVTLDGKGNRDIIENDKNGYLFHEENAELFANKIIEFTTDKKKYKEMSDFAQNYAKTFDVSIKNKKLIEFYESILD